MKLAIRIRAMLTALLLTFGLVLSGLTSTTAEAVDWNRPSRMYKHDGGWMPVWGVPRGNSNPIGWVRHGTTFYMHCWTDNIWYHGNYGSHRYFYGYNGYWGYVHSSFVYNQIAVPRC